MEIVICSSICTLSLLISELLLISLNGQLYGVFFSIWSLVGVHRLWRLGCGGTGKRGISSVLGSLYGLLMVDVNVSGIWFFTLLCNDCCEFVLIFLLFFNKRDGHRRCKRKNMKRLGGGGLPLHIFGNLKSNNSRKNAFISKRLFSFTQFKNTDRVSC